MASTYRALAAFRVASSALGSHFPIQAREGMSCTWAARRPAGRVSPGRLGGMCYRAPAAVVAQDRAPGSTSGFMPRGPFTPCAASRTRARLQAILRPRAGPGVLKRKGTAHLPRWPRAPPSSGSAPSVRAATSRLSSRKPR
ncbi:hypothetical protein AURDEDRAFT_146792 [Auricularia subglabra TFB-10046 SS5]|nr:hypothetical protein AURDEDRAFT_146792 [Auricularia subglabra TFB-10046 SS5]